MQQHHWVRYQATPHTVYNHLLGWGTLLTSTRQSGCTYQSAVESFLSFPRSPTGNLKQYSKYYLPQKTGHSKAVDLRACIKRHNHFNIFTFIASFISLFVVRNIYYWITIPPWLRPSVTAHLQFFVRSVYSTNTRRLKQSCLMKSRVADKCRIKKGTSIKLTDHKHTILLYIFAVYIRSSSMSHFCYPMCNAN